MHNGYIFDLIQGASVSSSGIKFAKYPNVQDLKIGQDFGFLVQDRLVQKFNDLFALSIFRKIV